MLFHSRLPGPKSHFLASKVGQFAFTLAVFTPQNLVTFQDYRRDSELLLQRPRSPPNGGRTEDEAANVNQAANLEAFRRIAQAHAERERFLPGAAGVLHGGINAATIAAQGLTGSASDYMRLAMPVRDPDNGDAISGSGMF